jgi:ADP-heptose:LPS heptosyltransferase
MAPEKLVPLVKVTGVEFVSLQVDPRGPLPPALAAAEVRDVSGQIGNFADSAALMAELDLIITVDTATAHLAATLGRPTWVLLAQVPYWPYGPEGETTPWYPTMKLFRQRVFRDWDSVVEQVVAELETWKG